MHERDVTPDAALRPKSSRIGPTAAPPRWQAAGDGRPEALDAAGVLGLQRAAGNAGVSSLFEQDTSPVHDVVNSSGDPMAASVRQDMEARLGHDFSDVRLHTDGAAHDSARSVNAQAYTVGSDVVFQQGKYDPSSDEGRHVLAHELTHVVQQRSGPVDGTDAGGGVKISDPSDRFEREAAGAADASLAGDSSRSAPAAMQPVGASVQREEAPEDEELQTYVQREEALQDEELQG